MKALIAIFAIFVSLNAFSAERDGIKFEDKVKVENKELVLNGIGIRKATILKIKVYYGALYLETKSKDPKAFIASTSPKQIVMHYVRDVDAKSLRNGFNEGMEAANPNHSTYQAAMAKFNAQIPDVVKNDLIVVTFLNDGVVVTTKGKTSEKIGDQNFSRALLNIWFTNPRDEQLMKDLLGNN